MLQEKKLEEGGEWNEWKEGIEEYWELERKSLGVHFYYLMLSLNVFVRIKYGI